MAVMDSSPTTRRRDAALLLLVALILLLGAGLRFYRLDAQSFWNDEGNSARIAERPLSRIIEGAAGDIHPPGYYVLLAGWRTLAGQSEFALRSFSALVSVLAVAVVYAVGARLFGWRVGVIAALLAAVSPFQVYYAQEARMYALLALLSAASIRLTIAVLSLPARMQAGRFNPRRAAAIGIGYILVNAAGLYTHYLFPMIIVAESLVFLIWLAGRSRRLHGLTVWGLLQGATLLLFAPWLSIAFRQIATWPRGVGGGVDALRLGSTLVYGVTLSPDTARIGLIPLLIVAAVGIFPPLDPDGERHPLRWEERLGLIAGWLLVPPAALAALGALSEPFLKFLLPCNLALGVLVARGAVMGFELGRPLPGASAANAFLTRLVVIILLASGLYPIYAGLRGLYTDPAYARDDYRAIAARILAEAGPEAAVVLDAPNQWEVFTYYYPDGPGVTPLPNDSTGETLEDLLRTHQRIYALFWGEAQQDPDHIVERMLEANAFALSTEWYGGVRLVTYAVPNGAGATEALEDVIFGDTIRLVGFTLSDERLSPGEALGVSLFWETDAPLEVRYKVFVHLYAPDGVTIVAQHDSEPNGNLSPTDSWVPGERITDNHGLLLPPDAEPGTYRLMVGLYDFEGNRLPITRRGLPVGDRLLLAELPVE